jgi:hypothetical protein
MNALELARLENDVRARLGNARATEASRPQMPSGGLPFGPGYLGVDRDRGKYRARIRYCNALSGQDTRKTLYRGTDIEAAAHAYRYAHVLLWGNCSWAV